MPVALFQGLEDKVVPPNQAEEVYEQLSAKGVPTVCVLFEGEQVWLRARRSLAHKTDKSSWRAAWLPTFCEHPAGVRQRAAVLWLGVRVRAADARGSCGPPDGREGDRGAWGGGYGRGSVTRLRVWVDPQATGG